MLSFKMANPQNNAEWKPPGWLGAAGPPLKTGREEEGVGEIWGCIDNVFCT